MDTNSFSQATVESDMTCQCDGFITVNIISMAMLSTFLSFMTNYYGFCQAVLIMVWVS